MVFRRLGRSNACNHLTSRARSLELLSPARLVREPSAAQSRGLKLYVPVQAQLGRPNDETSALA